MNERVSAEVDRKKVIEGYIALVREAFSIYPDEEFKERTEFAAIPIEDDCVLRNKRDRKLNLIASDPYKAEIFIKKIEVVLFFGWRMTPRREEAIRLKYNLGGEFEKVRSAKEVGSLMGITEAMVNQHLRRGLRIMGTYKDSQLILNAIDKNIVDNHSSL